MTTQNLNFLTALSGEAPNGTLVIPDSMNLVAKVDIKGPEYKANLRLKEGQGAMDVNAALNTATEVYKADLKIDNLQLHSFLPKDSIYELSLSAAANGRGLDVMSYHSFAKLNLALDQLHYAKYHLSDLDLTGELKGALVTAPVSYTHLTLPTT